MSYSELDLAKSVWFGLQNGESRRRDGGVGSPINESSQNQQGRIAEITQIRSSHGRVGRPRFNGLNSQIPSFAFRLMLGLGVVQ